MRGIDWRELYAENRAAIARAGIPAAGEVHAPFLALG
jgi:hypothetical protein